jgi:hypothetical protein
MRNSTHRLPAWLAGIATLVATAGVASAEPNDPNAIDRSADTHVASTQDCAPASEPGSAPCEHEQAAAMAGGEDDDSSAGLDEAGTANVEDRVFSDDANTGTDRTAQRSPDETPQTRVVPPAHATPAPQAGSDSTSTASSTSTGQNDDDAASTAAAGNGSQSDAGQTAKQIATAHEPATSVVDEDTNATASREDDQPDRAESIASDSDEPSTRSVPPAHATRMPETKDAWSSSSTAANDRDGQSRESGAAAESTRGVEDAGHAGDHQERAAPYATANAGIQGQFDELDRNHDGMVDAAEAGTSTTLRAQFFSLDRNGDGKLSMSEFKGAADIASIRPDRRESRQ